MSMKFVVLCLVFFLLFSCNETEKKSSKINRSKDSSGLLLKQFTKARIKTIHGDIVFKFLNKDAPNTTERIKELISKNFYNGLTFHRVIPGFVIQGGDPKGNGTGGSGKNLKAEFNKNKHIPGTVAMARSSDPNSADSQFYISLGTHPHLDNQYTIFGYVESGLEIAQNIKRGDKMITVTLE